MENRLSLRGEFLPPQALAQIEVLTDKLVDSKALPSSITNGAQLAMVFLAGYEAGMTPMQSLNSFYIVNGKVTIWGQAVLVQLKLAGWDVEWVESTDLTCTVTISKGTKKHTETFTFEEAKTAGLTHKDPWKKYPRNMLRWKALGNAVRFFCPEVLGGYYIKEEIESDLEVEVMDAGAPSTGKRGRKNTPPPAATIDVSVAPVEEKSKLDEKLNKAIHAIWNEIAEINGWTTEETNGKRKATLKAKYGVESNNDLTEVQAHEFIDRSKAVKEKMLAAKAKADTEAAAKGETVAPAEEQKTEEPAKEDGVEAAHAVADAFGGKVIEKCPTCKKEYEDDKSKTGDAEAIRFAGECNSCLNGKA